MRAGRRPGGRRARAPPPPPPRRRPPAPEAPGDPDSQGFRERALLAAFVESLDPESREAFGSFMEQQLADVQQRAAEGGAAAYVEGLAREAGAAGDPAGYFSSEEGRAASWRHLRGQFSAEQLELLDECLGGPDWGAFDPAGLDAQTMMRLSQLGADKQAALIDLMSRASSMMGQMEALQQRMESGGGTSGSNTGGGGGGGGAAGAGSKPAWGASFRRPRARRPGGRGAGAGLAAAAAEEYWDKFLDREMAGRVQAMMSLAGQAAQGQLQWGQPPSRHFQEIKRIHRRLVQVEAAERRQPPLPPEQAAWEYQQASAELTQLAAQVGAGGGDPYDTPARSALLYIDAVFNGGGGGEEEARGEAEEAEERRRQRGGGGRGLVDERRLARLGRFLAAAENLPAFQAWLSVFSDAHPGLASEEMLLLSRLASDDWFIRPGLQDQALAAARAAVEAAEGGCGGAASAASGALLPYVDESRVEALAAADADALWFLAELIASGYSDQVIMKWSLHPRVGPRLAGGSWAPADGLPPELSALWERAAASPEFMGSLNFDLRRTAGGKG